MFDMQLSTSPHDRRASFRSTTSFRSTATAATSATIMKLLPSRRRQNEEVKRTSFILDDYAKVLSRDSGFLSGDAMTVSTASGSINESSHASTTGGGPRSSTVSLAANSMGSFAKQEVTLGALLGKGHFSKVYEITAIELNSDADAEDAALTGFLDPSATARQTMSQNARAGKYAMKRLRKKLLRRPREFTRAAANLMLEAKFLSKLDHPHILKLRGSALGGASSFETGEHDAYFLILDRLSETLSERIYHSLPTQRQAGSVNETELLCQKTHYALQLASALVYLHERRVIFRDVKPCNLGFTEEHSMQLFDFGLARELPQALGLSNELFHMTQNAGSKPYTAVEVATNGMYNLKADVYSFGVVMFEMFAETMPFAHLAGKGKKPFDNKEFVQAAYVDGERPSFDELQNENSAGPIQPPQELQELLSKCWSTDLFVRPTMDDVFGELEGIYEELTQAHSHRTEFVSTMPKIPSIIVKGEQQEERSFRDLSELNNDSSNNKNGNSKDSNSKNK